PVPPFRLLQVGSNDSLTPGQPIMQSAVTSLPPSRPPTFPPGLADRIFQALCLLAGLSIIAIAVLLVLILGWQAWPALSHAGEYRIFTSSEWNPHKTPPIYGSLAFVFGTLTTSCIAMLIAVPLGVGSAAFLAEIAPGWIRRVGSFLIELLAAVPSVVYGFWGMYFLRPAVQWLFNLMNGPNTSGAGIFAAGIILAIMIVPYITAITFDVCRAVPHSQREGALALGATRWQMIRTAVLPYARPGIMAACFLALGRALGETMAVTMMIGNRPEIKFSIFAMGDSIASVIANRLNEADSPEIRSALVSLGLTLLLITSILNITGRLLIRRLGKPRKKIIQSKAPRPESNGEAQSLPPGLATVQGEPPQPLPSPRGNQISNRIMTIL